MMLVQQGASLCEDKRPRKAKDGEEEGRSKEGRKEGFPVLRVVAADGSPFPHDSYITILVSPLSRVTSLKPS